MKEYIESGGSDPKVNNFPKVGWSLVYSEENGVLITPNLCKVERERQVGARENVYVWKAT